MSRSSFRERLVDVSQADIRTKITDYKSQMLPRTADDFGGEGVRTGLASTTAPAGSVKGSAASRSRVTFRAG
jgi:hypothetical protein